MNPEPTAEEWAELSGKRLTDADEIWLEEKLKTQEHVSEIHEPVPDLVPLPNEPADTGYLG